MIVAVLTSNTELAKARGNVLLTRGVSGLDKESVVNVSQLYTANKSRLTEQIRTLPAVALDEVERGLRLVLKI